ncbi:hypothetical protein BC834DRAFT_1034670, partial [Gloeopeniophorella convolvens]
MDDSSGSAIRIPVYRACMNPSEYSQIPLSDQVLFRAYNEWMETKDRFARDNKPVDKDWFADGERLLESTLPWGHKLLSYVLNAMFANGLRNLGPDLSHEDALWLIEQVILPCCTKAILLPFTIQDPEDESPFIISAFLCLSDALRERFGRTRRLSDLDATFTYYRHLLRIQIPEQIRLRRSRLPKDFASLVQWKIRSNTANGGVYLDELVTLSASLLPSHSVDAQVDADLVDFLEILVLWVCQLGRHDEWSNHAEQVASHLRVFLGVCPPAYRPQLSMMLALMLNEFVLPSHDNHVEIAALVGGSLPFLPSESALRPLASRCFNDLLSGTSLDPEEARLFRDRIALQNRSIQSLPDSEHLRLIAGALLERHEQFGDESSLKEAQRCLEELHRISGSGPGSSIASELRLEDLALSYTIRMAFNPVTGGPSEDPMPDLDVHRRNLRQIELGLEVLIQTDTDDEWDRVLLSLVESVSTLCSWGSVEDLDLGIGFLKYWRDVMPRGHPFTRANPHFPQGQLCGLFHRRFLLLRRREDLEECLSNHEATCKSLLPGDAWRLGDLDDWARIARENNHPSASSAYENAMLAMQRVVESGPNLQAQHASFKRGRAHGTRTSLDYASYHIEKGKLQAAVEVLDHGRSLLWSMMRGFRAPVGQLRAINPDLADKYLSITHDLESITTQSSALRQGLSAIAGSSGNQIRTIEEDTFGRVFEAQRRLLRERKAVISRIRTLPDFEHFLAAAPFHSLQSAASSGPIVIINHCEWSSDIIIVIHGRPLTHIRLGNDFYVSALALSIMLSEARNSEEGLDSEEYDRILRFVLDELYQLVGRQVVNTLDVLGIPKRSR